MEKKTNLKNLYSSIRDLLFKMIPERWDSIYLYASVMEDKLKKESGEMFFFYYPKSVIKKNPVNVYEIPTKFNINEEKFMNLAQKLYSLIKQLRHECLNVDKTLWSNITISIENVEFLVEYNFDDLKNSLYTDEERRIIWKYKYLDYPIEKLNKQEKSALKRYLEEEDMGQHGVTIYSETFYQKHIHNDIQYNQEQENYVQEKVEEQKENVEVKSQILRWDNK